MTTPDVQTETIKDIVLHDFHAAAVFEKYSLDFCCGGKKTIDAACREKGIDAAPVRQDLAAVLANAGTEKNGFDHMPLSSLIDHIISTHHAYVRAMIPVLYTHTGKIADVHGKNHPELVRIAELFGAVAEELHQHMMKEERMLFPFIKALDAAAANGTSPAPAPFGTIQNPIRMMEAEHQNAGDALYEVRSLSSGYIPPDDACTTYRVTLQELQDFEHDLHAHVHLENNILFPGAIRMEQELFAS